MEQDINKKIAVRKSNLELLESKLKIKELETKLAFLETPNNN